MTQQVRSTGGSAAQKGIFVRSGEYWTIGLGSTTFSLKDVLGLRYIQRLLQHPGEQFHALDLVSEAASGIAENPGADRASILSDATLSVRGLGDAGEMLDATAKQEYRRRLGELREELEELKERGAFARAAEVEAEIDFLVHEIARAVGFGGRDRRAGSTTERARLNVTRAIKAAIQKICDCDSPLGEVLSRSIKTGSSCSYTADPNVAVRWQFLLSHPTEASVEPELTSPPLPHRPNLLAEAAAGTPFVGRQVERVFLRQILERARRGEGSVVTFAGAPGVGKTRLSLEFANEAAKSGFFPVMGGCSDREEPVPFLPFVEILESALGNSPSPKAFRDILGDEAGEAARLLPQLRKTFPDIPPPLEIPPEQSRRILLSAVTKVIERAALSKPLILVLEDLHWADEGTLSLLQHLARSIPRMPVVVVGTYRDNELDPAGPLAAALDGLIRLHLLEQISLRGLPRADVAELIRELSGREPPEALVTLIYFNTEGNPFFVEELFRHLLERGKLTDDNGEFRTGSNIPDIEVPHNVRLVIGRRVARLSEGTQRVLDSAAVIGRSFSFELLEASTGADPDALLDSIDEAETAGLILSRLIYPEALFQFSHELTRRVVIDGQSPARRQRLHLKVADAIEHLYRDNVEDHAEDLAHHLWHAGAATDPVRTLRYLQMAGGKAVQRSANVEAINHFRNALKLVGSTPETPERLQQEFMLHTTLGTALVATKGFSSLEVGSVFARARELSQQGGEVPQLFRALWGLWINYASRAEYRAGFEMAEQCMRLAQSTGDSGLLTAAYQALGVSCCTAGEFVRAREHLEQAIAIYDPVQHDSLKHTYGQDPGATNLIHLGWTLWFLGYPDQALKRNVEGLALARRLNHPATLATAAAFGAWNYSLWRDSKAVAELATETIAVSTEHDAVFNRAIGVALAGWALAQGDHKESGIAQMRAGVEGFRAADGIVMLAYFSALLAETYGEIGQASQGLRVLADLEHSDERYLRAELQRLKGELLLKQSGDSASQDSNEAEAEKCFREALSIAHAQQAKSLELRAAMSMSRLLLGQGKRSEADQVLAKVYEWFTEGFNTADLRAAQVLLEELRVRDPRN